MKLFLSLMLLGLLSASHGVAIKSDPEDSVEHDEQNDESEGPKQ